MWLSIFLNCFELTQTLSFEMLGLCFKTLHKINVLAFIKRYAYDVLLLFYYQLQYGKNKWKKGNTWSCVKQSIRYIHSDILFLYIKQQRPFLPFGVHPLDLFHSPLLWHCMCSKTSLLLLPVTSLYPVVHLTFAMDSKSDPLGNSYVAFGGFSIFVQSTKPTRGTYFHLLQIRKYYLSCIAIRVKAIKE